MNKFTVYEVQEDERLGDLGWNQGLVKHDFPVVPRIGEMIIVEDKYYEVLQVVHTVSGKCTHSALGERLPYVGSIYVKACNVPGNERYPYLPATTFKYFRKWAENLEEC